MADIKLTPEKIKAIADAEKKAYMHEWRRKNKARIKEYNANYWEKKAMQKLKDNDNGEV